MIDQIAVSDLLNSMVPISRFNKGEANKIFDEVNASGYKVVVKNNRPTCVLMAPDKYEEMIETLEDYRLYIEAERRAHSARESEFISQEDALGSLGVSQEDLDGAEVEIE